MSEKYKIRDPYWRGSAASVPGKLKKAKHGSYFRARGVSAPVTETRMSEKYKIPYWRGSAASVPGKAKKGKARKLLPR